MHLSSKTTLVKVLGLCQQPSFLSNLLSFWEAIHQKILVLGGFNSQNLGSVRWVCSQNEEFYGSPQQMKHKNADFGSPNFGIRPISSVFLLPSIRVLSHDQCKFVVPWGTWSLGCWIQIIWDLQQCRPKNIDHWSKWLFAGCPKIDETRIG